MEKNPLFCGLAAGCSALALTACSDEAGRIPERPNIVFILADDLGYGDLSCYGQERFRTPWIDSLAASGMRFTQAYAGTTVSAPSRSCLITGLHSGRTQVRGNLEVSPEGQMSLTEGPNLFSLFQAAGYRTGVFGKWGLGAPGTDGDPMRRGVDRFYGYNCQLLAHNYYPDHLWDNEKRVDLPENADGRTGSYAQDLIHGQALRFLRESGDRPFFLFLPYVLPHAELLVPEDSILQRFRGRYPETPYRGCDSGPAFRRGGYCSQPEPRATFAAMVTRLDLYVGQVMQTLKEEGLLDHTIIVFASDNGPHREGGADPDFFNSNGIWRGYKRDLYEGGIRVPFIVSGPGIVPASENDEMIAFWDLYPTFAALLGQPAEESDGLSLLPLWTGSGHFPGHDFLYFEFHEGGGRQAVRQGDWKLVHLNVSSPGKDTWELYFLPDDPGETRNVASRFPERVRSLQELMCASHRPDPVWPLLPGE